MLIPKVKPATEAGNDGKERAGATAGAAGGEGGSAACFTAVISANCANGIRLGSPARSFFSGDTGVAKFSACASGRN